MVKYKIAGKFITLGQFLKVEDFVSSGGMVKTFIEENKIYVNDKLETKRGKKLYPNDKLKINNKEYLFE